MTFASEQELAAHVSAWMRGQGWTVHEEVRVGDRVMDLVGRRGPKLWAVECKLRMSLALCVQALEHVGHVHLVSVAVPAPKWAALKPGNLRGPAGLLSRLGIGTLCVSESGAVHALQDPLAKTPRGAGHIVLTEEQTTGEYARAGSSRGGHFTKASAFGRRVVEYVESHPDCSIEAIVGRVMPESNPATAALVLDKKIRTGQIPGIHRYGAGRMRRYRVEGE